MQQLDLPAPVPLAPAHWQSLPTPPGWLSLISHGPPYGGVEGGSASRHRGRWPTAHPAASRTPFKWLR